MFMPRFTISLSVVLLVWAGSLEAQSLSATNPKSPNLGKKASEDILAAWDMSVSPSGDGLPEGSGTPQTGALLYQKHCAACHGEAGTGGPNNALVSPRQGSSAETRAGRTIGNYWPYATTVFDYIRRAMPYTHPQSLADSEVYALTAYLLYENGVVSRDFEATSETLPDVVMPNHANFRRAYPDWKP